MRELLAQIDRWQASGEKLAMATLVQVRGSAPRLPGARLVLSESGAMLGSVSAGCVENDVYEHGRQVLASGQPQLVTYGIEKEAAFEVGLSCGGSIDVLVEPFAPGTLWKALREAVETREPAALAMAVQPAPLRGRKLFLAGAAVVGAIDPALDAEIEALLRRACQPGSGVARVVAMPWQNAEAEIFIEPLLPAARLFIIGANHTAIALCRMAKELGYWVTVIDPRAVFATPERFSEVDELLHVWPDEFFAGRPLDPYSFVVALSHDAKFDVPALACALRADTGYIGILGSRRTHASRLEMLREQGFGDADFARIHAPIGLDLGGRAPAEIALAILAEMQAVRYGRGAGALKDRQAPIHAEPGDA